VEGVDGDSNFFELGGHSLLATVLLVRIRSKFDVDLEPEDVFKVPALKDFARLVVIKQLEQLGVDVDGFDPSAAAARAT
jgi:acyl carrier protein